MGGGTAFPSFSNFSFSVSAPVSDAAALSGFDEMSASVGAWAVLPEVLPEVPAPALPGAVLAPFRAAFAVSSDKPEPSVLAEVLAEELPEVLAEELPEVPATTLSPRFSDCEAASEGVCCVIAAPEAASSANTEAKLSTVRLASIQIDKNDAINAHTLRFFFDFLLIILFFLPFFKC
jgi:hypothetical protein